MRFVLVFVVLALVLGGTILPNLLIGTANAYPYPYGPLHPYGPPNERQGSLSSGTIKIGDTNTPPRTGIAVSQHGQDSLTIITVGKDGAMYVTYKSGSSKWNTAAITPKGIFPPSANVAMTQHTPTVLTALAIGNDGAIYVAWTAPGGWNKQAGSTGPRPYPPVQITPLIYIDKEHAHYPGFYYPKFPPGGNIAIIKQTNDMLTALAIASDGKLYQLWLSNNRQWNQPVNPTNMLHKDWFGRVLGDCSPNEPQVREPACPPYPPIPRAQGVLPGAPIAVYRNADNTLTALTAGGSNSQLLYGIQIENKPPTTICCLDKIIQDTVNPRAFFQRGSGIAIAQQLDNQATALIVGNDGAMYVTWAFSNGKWQGPVPLTPPNIFPPGAAIAMAKQTKDVLNAIAVGNDGALYRSWVVGGAEWNKPPPGTFATPPFAPQPITPKGMFNPGEGVALLNFNGVLEGFVIGKDKGVYTSWLPPSAGKWNGPVKIS